MKKELLKIRECHITGRIKGIFDKDTKEFNVIIGTDKNGNKYQKFKLEIAKPNKKDGGWINGKDIDVTLFGDYPDLNDGESIGLGNCSFEPRNYTRDGREIKGNGLIASAEHVFQPEEWEAGKEVSEELRIRECHITGSTTGIFNRDTKEFNIIIGTDKNGNKYQKFKLEIARPNKDNSGWTNGKDIDVTLFGDYPDIIPGQPIGLGNCSFEPRNHNRDGREIKDNGIVASATYVFEPSEWEKR
jgi:phosphotransferase system IIB component